MEGDQFKTAQDMYDYWYKPTAKGEILKPVEELMQSVMHVIAKADDPLLTSTSGWTNTAYGRVATNWLNMETNIHGVLPKKPWPAGRRGYRCITANATRFAGRAENASLEDTDKPTWTQMYAPIVVMQNTFEWTFDSELKSQYDDSLEQPGDLRDYYAEFHPENIDYYLGRKANTVTGATYIIESLDRMISSSTEATYFVSSGGLTGATAANIYPGSASFKRMGGQTTFDAYVDCPTDNTDRALTETMLKDLVSNAKEYGANLRNCVILTGYDTKDDIDDIIGAKQRYVNTEKMVSTINGVQRSSLIGTTSGFEVDTFAGIPILTAQHIAKTGTKSNVYLVDMDHMWIQVAWPTTFLQADNYILIDAMRKKAMYYTAEQLVCDKFNTQGKITYLG